MHFKEKGWALHFATWLILVNKVENFGLRKMWGNSRLAVELSAFQGGLCCLQ
jgi:hypothetical protein